jgi:hypothetical protein
LFKIKIRVDKNVGENVTYQYLIRHRVELIPIKQNEEGCGKEVNLIACIPKSTPKRINEYAVKRLKVNHGFLFTKNTN